MSIQYLLVTCPDNRAVLADGSGVGFTNHTLMLPADEYAITLDASGYDPPSCNIVLAGTSIVKPLVVAFARSTKFPAAGAEGSTALPTGTDTSLAAKANG
jgi:hypothetical protein